MITTAIILAGGFGTRLQSVVNDLPKPMAPINGEPFLNYQLNYLKHYGIKNVILSVGYLAEKIKAYYGSNSSRYGTIEKTKENIISSFKEKSGIDHEGIINGGVYLLDKNLYLQKTPSATNFSIEKDFFEKQLSNSLISGFEFEGYFIDIGIPEDYLKAQHEFKGFKYK